MITTTVTTPTAAAIYSGARFWGARLSWGSIIGGCFAALSIHLLLTIFFAALGVAFINPQPRQGDLPALSISAGIAWCVSALISLWVGGWIAGRTAPRAAGNSGGIHGLLVWSVATVLTFVFFTGGGGALIGGALKTAGSGMSRAVNVAAAGLGNPALRDLSSPDGLIASFLDEASGGVTPQNQFRAKRDVGIALGKLFNDKDASARETLVNALVNYGNRSRADAEATVSAWEDTYKRTLETAEVIATKAAKKAAVMATWTFMAFALGAFFAAWGGRSGGKRQLFLYPETVVETTPVRPSVIP